MSHKSKVDPRAKRSRQWLQTALMELIVEKGYQKTSVKDITERAGLSRPTFYLHYHSKEEILMDQVDMIFDPIMEEFNELRKDPEIDQPGSLAMTKLFEGIQDQLDVFKTLIEAGAEKLLLEQMYSRNLTYLKDLARRCEMEITPEVLELSSRFIAGAFVGVLISWVQGEHPHSADKIGEFVSEAGRPLLRAAICNGELDYIFLR